MNHLETNINHILGDGWNKYRGIINVYIYMTMIITHSKKQLVLHMLRIQAFFLSSCSCYPEACFKRWHLMRRYDWPAGFFCGCPKRMFYGRNTSTS